MKYKNNRLFEEAYISALQKTVEVPADTKDISTSRPDTGAAVELKAEPNLQIHLEPSDVEDTHEDEHHSEESRMVKTNLFSLFNNAKAIHTFAQEGLELEPWMQQKIAVATDHLESVMKSVAYRAAEREIGD